MPRPSALPPDDELKKLLGKGLTHHQIAGMFGVTDQAVSNRVRLNNLAPAPPRYPDEVPWIPAEQHRAQYLLRMLRLNGKQKSGRELRPGEAAALKRFVDRLNETGDVVGYDPGVGFYYTPRREGIDRGLIREPV